MTILEKWRFMMLSFADIKAAVIEKGGNISADKGYNRYANAIRQLYSDTSTDEYAYPERLPIAISNAINYVHWCKAVKEQIRQAIIAGGVECGTDVPLSEYGNKVRKIQVFEVVSFDIDIREYSDTFTMQLQARGGKPPYKWQRLYGGGGLELSVDGMLSGNVAVGDGMYKMCVQVTDSTGKQIQKEGWITAHHKTLRFTRRGENRFEYDGKPHSLEIVCYNYPEVQVTSLLYGGKKADGVTERGQYMVEIGSVSNVPKGYYRVDYNYHSTITIV